MILVTFANPYNIPEVSRFFKKYILPIMAMIDLVQQTECKLFYQELSLADNRYLCD